MKRFIILLLVLARCTCAAAVADEPTALPVVWEISEGLMAPESACFDSQTGLLFLSQIGAGGGAGEDGDGWISKVSPDGRMLTNRWITGLNAPKGIRTFGNSLYVSDINRLVEIDIAAGRIKRVVPVPDAQFLNDVATDSRGQVYVSDMVASRIYQLNDAGVSVFAEGPQLEHPNGLLVDGNRLVIGGWGRGFNTEDFSTKHLGRLQIIDLTTKRLSTITDQPTGHLDGIESDGRGGYVVTDWRRGKLFHIAANGTTRLLRDFPQGVADHAYLADRGLLILPQMLEGRLTAFRFRP